MALLACVSNASAESEPLHSLVDKLLAPAGGVTASMATDAEFLRRASLDVAGMPPTADEARAFLAESSPDKRIQLVDRLLASPHFARHFAQTLDLILMERRPNTNVSTDEWQAWLLQSVRENKPWNAVAREILTADGADPAKRAPARFTLDRGSDPNMLTRDIGRIFFGRDMQCAQCHDHPLVNAYLQSDYQGLFAFLQPGYALTLKQGEKQIVVQAEHSGTNVNFQSVFLHVPRRTAARVPGGLMIDEPFYLPGEEYQVAPGDNVKSIPKFSYREKLAELATNGSNEAFNRNIANRLWAIMFGRGLVHPVDMQNPDNPPSNPELLHLLGEQIAAMKFDMRAFLRELTLTAAYQRSFDPPADTVAAGGQAAKQIEQLEADEAAAKLAADDASQAYEKAAEAWEKVESNTMPPAAELDAAKTQYADAKKKMDDATKAAADAAAQLAAKKGVASPVEQAATAAQAAVKALPADKELADAAQKIAAKAQQLSTEAAALAKAADEKTAAVAPTTDAWQKTKPPVDAALQKVTPLVKSLQEAEAAMLAARQQASHSKEKFTALERRLSTVKKIAQVAELNKSLVSARQIASAQEAGVTNSQRLVAEYLPIAAAQEAAAKVKSDSAAAAAKATQAARDEVARCSAGVDAIAAACKTTEAAHHKAPDNAVLTDSLAQLQECVARAQAAVAAAEKNVNAAVAAQQAADQAVVASQEALAAALAERARREQAATAAIAALTAAKTDVATKQSAVTAAATELNERWANDFTIASLKPLTPEQMCWSVFRVTGVYDRYWQTEVAELDKAKPLTEAQKKDAAQLAARQAELEQRTFDKLKGNIGTFVAFYGAAAGQPQGDFFATADQALFVANGGSVNSWVAPAGDNVTERIVKQPDPQAAADELYLSVFTRKPTDAERADIVNYLKDRAQDKAAAAQELVWALLNSAEFRFNH
ncbi:MAG: DUF1549 domain-containing protein [Pirellulales bacterium]